MNENYHYAHNILKHVNIFINFHFTHPFLMLIIPQSYITLSPLFTNFIA